MKTNRMRWWQVCVLGAVDGLAVGAIVEALRLLYEKHRIEALLQEAVARDTMVGYMLNPAVDLLIPAVSVVVFAGVSHLVYRYLKSRPRFLLLCWLTASAIAVGAGYVMTGRLEDPVALVLFAGLGYVVFRLWRSHLDSLVLMWEVIGVSSVIVVAAAAQIVGLFAVQRFELRRPLTWLLCLLAVLLVNFVFGTLLRLVFPQFSQRGIHVYD